jgi:hypothetical protein
MCTVRIKVDETVMQRINPSQTSSELIGEWLQEQVDMLIGEFLVSNNTRITNIHIIDIVCAFLLFVKEKSGKERYSSATL